jgi:hypothetical protein
VPSNRVLKAVVIGLGVLIVIALAALVAGIFVKSGGHGTANGDAPYALPPGAAVVWMQTQPDRLVLHLRTDAGDEVDIFDLADGHLIARIRAPK